MFGLPSVAGDVRALALRQTDEAGMKQLENRLRLVSGRGGCKHPDGTARFVASGLRAFGDEVALHLDGRCSVAGSRQDLPRLRCPCRPPDCPRSTPTGKDFT